MNSIQQTQSPSFEVTSCTQCPFGWENIERGNDEYTLDIVYSGCSVLGYTRSKPLLSFSILEKCPLKKGNIIVSLKNIEQYE